jgi:hypothetical protein
VCAAGRVRRGGLGRMVRHETGPDQPMSQQIGQPCGIVDVGLTTGHVLQVGRVRQDQLELTVGENVPDRLPINARRLHDDVRHAFCRQPIGQKHQFGSSVFESLDRSGYLAPRYVTNASHHRVLMYIQTSAMRIENFHRCSLCAGGVEPCKRKSRKRAPGQKHRPWHSQGCSKVPGPTDKRDHEHQGKTDLCADRGRKLYTMNGTRFIRSGSVTSVGDLQLVASREYRYHCRRRSGTSVACFSQRDRVLRSAR